MAKCQDCKQEMTKVVSCSLKFRCIKIGGEIHTRDTSSFDFNDRCHDCNIENQVGNLHHFGCDMEKCPKCGSQLIGCDCKKEEIGVNKKWHKI